MSDGDHNKIVVGKEVSWFWKSRRRAYWWCASAPLLAIFLDRSGSFALQMLALSGFFICLALSCDKKR
jgi:hypothetical protein